MGLQKRCRIKSCAIMVKGGRMPQFMYQEELEIVRETESSVFVKYEHSNEIFEFNKKCIDKMIA